MNALSLSHLSEVMPALRDRILELADVLKPAIEKHHGEVGLAVKHLKTGETFEYMADRPMPTASLIKLPVMITAYEAVDKGKLSLSVYTAEKGLGVEPDHNVLKELAGSPEPGAWKPETEVFKDVEHVSHPDGGRAEAVDDARVAQAAGDDGVRGCHADRPPPHADRVCRHRGNDHERAPA